jgi:hypothetical protein
VAAEGTTWAKFVQIAVNQSGLFALDEQGQVWFYNPKMQRWLRMPRRRSSQRWTG